MSHVSDLTLMDLSQHLGICSLCRTKLYRLIMAIRVDTMTPSCLNDEHELCRLEVNPMQHCTCECHG